jgi:hypothetical protein
MSLVTHEVDEAQQPGQPLLPSQMQPLTPQRRPMPQGAQALPPVPQRSRSRSLVRQTVPSQQPPGQDAASQTQVAAAPLPSQRWPAAQAAPLLPQTQTPARQRLALSPQATQAAPPLPQRALSGAMTHDEPSQQPAPQVMVSQHGDW